MRSTVVMILCGFSLSACGDSTGTGIQTLSGSWVQTTNPPRNGWTIKASGETVSGTAWVDFSSDTGPLEGTRRGDSLFLTFESHAVEDYRVPIMARVVGDTIVGHVGDVTIRGYDVRLVRSAPLPSGYVNLSVRGATTLDYTDVPGRFWGSSQDAFYLWFETRARVPNAMFVLEGVARPAPGQYTIGPGQANRYHATGAAGRGDLDAASGTLTITRSTALAITGRMQYESVDPASGARTTVVASFDLPCTDQVKCQP